MAKAKTNKPISKVSSEIYELLDPFGPEERGRILNGVRALLGESNITGAAGGGPGPAGGGGAGAGAGAGAGGGRAPSGLAAKGAQAYFDEKNPKNKNEEFATAARFLELTSSGGPGVVTRDALQRIIGTEARRSFHQGNFPRDMGNAEQAKFFNLGGSVASGYTLSHVGQKYVDALPDRAAAKAVKKAAKSGKKRKAPKKKKAGAKT